MSSLSCLSDYLIYDIIKVIEDYCERPFCRICQLLADLREGGSYEKLNELIETKETKELEFTDRVVKLVSGYSKLQFKLTNMMLPESAGCTECQTKVKELCTILQSLPVPPMVSSTSTRIHQPSKLDCCGRYHNGCTACRFWRRKILRREWKSGCGRLESFRTFLSKLKDGNYDVNDFNRLTGFRGLLKTLNYKLNTCQDCQRNFNRLRLILSYFNNVQTADQLRNFKPDESVRRFKPRWCCAECKYFTLDDKVV